jgi:hypothetical protein
MSEMEQKTGEQQRSEAAQELVGELRGAGLKWIDPPGLVIGIPRNPKMIWEALVSERVENERLMQWVDDLQSGMYVNCVYCGHRYGPQESTPVTVADALKQYIFALARIRNGGPG